VPISRHHFRAGVVQHELGAGKRVTRLFLSDGKNCSIDEGLDYAGVKFSRR
jgi:hypothetical protein